MKFMNVLLSIALLFISWSCTTSEERDFKNAAKKLKQTLIELNNINIKTEKANIKIDGEAVYYLNDEKRNVFIIDKKNEWEKLSKQLKSYIIKYPKGPWADDAGFCLVMMYLSISQRQNVYYIEAINEIKSFLSRFSSINIENWTKREFIGVSGFKIIFREITTKDECVKRILNLPEEKSIRSFFTRAIVIELLKVGKVSEAKEELKTLQKESVEGKEFFACLQNEIERYEEYKKIVIKPVESGLRN